ncbi:MAG TPA: FHA domain-containing protein [Terriglobales bacterium]|nr:FHA domain-containing protein [Terriglobales bacterium]
MGATVVVEILDRRGRLKERQRLASLPATLGRSYACEVILDDPFVSPEHLRVEQRDERLVAVDLGTTNGTRLATDNRRITEIELDGDLGLRLGETVVRLRTASAPIAPALPLRRVSVDRGRWQVGGRLALAWLIAMTLAVMTEYLATYEELRAVALVSQVTSTTSILLAWSGLWAISNRIVTHRFHFLEHCLNATFWAIFFLLIQQVSGYVAFALALDEAVTAATWMVNGALFGGMLYGHLELCSSMPRPRVAATAFGIAASLTLLSALATVVDYLQGPQWDFMVRFRNELKPPMFRLADSETVESFFADTRELKQRIDALAKEKN